MSQTSSKKRWDNRVATRGRRDRLRTHYGMPSDENGQSSRTDDETRGGIVSEDGASMHFEETGERGKP